MNCPRRKESFWVHINFCLIFESWKSVEKNNAREEEEKKKQFFFEFFLRLRQSRSYLPLWKSQQNCLKNLQECQLTKMDFPSHLSTSWSYSYDKGEGELGGTMSTLIDSEIDITIICHNCKYFTPDWRTGGSGLQCCLTAVCSRIKMISLQVEMFDLVRTFLLV